MLSHENNKIMFSDTGKQNVLLPDESNKIMCPDTRKQRVGSWQEQQDKFSGHREAKRLMLPGKSNKIMFSDTGKQNVVLLTGIVI